MYITDLIETLEGSKVVVKDYALSFDKPRQLYVIIEYSPDGHTQLIFENINEEVSVHKLLDLVGG